MTRTVLSIIPAILASLAGAGAVAGTLPCSSERTTRSVEGALTEITLINRSKRAVEVPWLGFDGQRSGFAGADPGEARGWPTYIGYVYVVTDPDGRCLFLFRRTRGSDKIIVTD